jgi:tRNA nucleotidyltransferase (CCA-adding enzyme)
VAKAVYAVGDDIFLDLLKVKRADKSAQNPLDKKKGLEYVDLVESIYNGLKAEKNCLELKDLVIDGRDLIEMGFKEGREVGRALKFLFEKVLDDPGLNEKHVLTKLAAELLMIERKDKI